METKILLSTGEHALLLNSLLPTGSREVAEHRFQPGAALAADFTLSQAVGVTLNLGYVLFMQAMRVNDTIRCSGCRLSILC